MKKFSLPLAVIAMLIAVFAVVKNGQTSELVYVDVNKLIEGYKRTKVVRAAFETKAKTLKANVDSLVVGWQNELKQYETERSK